jgi:hypothetical protein
MAETAKLERVLGQKNSNICGVSRNAHAPELQVEIYPVIDEV